MFDNDESGRVPTAATLAPRQGGALRALRETNLRRILEAISRDGGVSQAEVARRTDLSRATVSNLVGELRRRGLVRIRDQQSGGRGGLEAIIGRSSNAVIGVDFGHRHVRVGIADLSGRLLADEERSLPLDLGVEESCAEAMEMATSLLAKAGLLRSDLIQAGVGLPGPIDPASGRVGWHAILHRWAGLEAPSILRELFGLPVVVDNDGNLGALGELRFGAGRGYTELVYLNIATGVGAGLVIGGRVYRGAAGTAGEIGHISIDQYGQLCRCGNRGCLDTVVGVDSFLEMLRGTYGDELTIPRVLDLADRGDARCRRAFADAGHALGVVIADVCNLLSPQRVVVGGELTLAGDLLFGPVRETLAQRAVPAAARAMEVVPCALGERAEMLGAIGLALDAVRAGVSTNALAVATTAR
ncbi:MAG: ROK family transcriptional regulator [Candidatus Dormibacteria bacterium]|jgi:predicted NBD/HSP70 family sugar kinase/biotin operon repressor